MTERTPAPEGVYGEVFTRRWVVEFVLDLAGYDPRLDLANRLVVEPSCGSGAFLVPIVERLAESCRNRGVNLGDTGGRSDRMTC